MKLIPLDDRVLVKPALEQEQKVGSIIIPDTAKEKPKMGEVIEVGTDEDLREVLKKGDRVVYAKYSGEEIKIDGVEHLIVQRGDILAVVK
ncbi:MAG: co-chaperone GroES [Deltaproteobacteria bacterium]|nr:co-chaperone GroES [Deltaproteobacteria bacterium]